MSVIYDGTAWDTCAFQPSLISRYDAVLTHVPFKQSRGRGYRAERAGSRASSRESSDSDRSSQGSSSDGRLPPVQVTTLDASATECARPVCLRPGLHLRSNDDGSDGLVVRDLTRAPLHFGCNAWWIPLPSTATLTMATGPTWWSRVYLLLDAGASIPDWLVAGYERCANADEAGEPCRVVCTTHDGCREQDLHVWRANSPLAPESNVSFEELGRMRGLVVVSDGFASQSRESSEGSDDESAEEARAPILALPERINSLSRHESDRGTVEEDTFLEVRDSVTAGWYGLLLRLNVGSSRLCLTITPPCACPSTVGS